MAFHVGPDLFHCLLQTGREIHRMESVNEEQATDNRILDELAKDVFTSWSTALDHLQHPT